MLLSVAQSFYRQAVRFLRPEEVTIAAKRLGCEVIACDRYENAPAMQVADTFEVFDMNNSTKLRQIPKGDNDTIFLLDINFFRIP